MYSFDRTPAPCVASLEKPAFRPDLYNRSSSLDSHEAAFDDAAVGGLLGLSVGIECWARRCSYDSTGVSRSEHSFSRGGNPDSLTPTPGVPHPRGTPANTD